MDKTGKYFIEWCNSHPERKKKKTEACSFSFVFFSSSKFKNMNIIWSNQINLESQK